MTVRREKEILRYADRRKKREERAVERLMHKERTDGGRRRIGRRWGRDRDRDRESGTGTETGSQGQGQGVREKSHKICVGISQ